MAAPEWMNDTALRSKRQEIRALLQSARIFCREYGLGVNDGSGVLANTLGTLKKYFPETSAARRMCSLLESVAIINPQGLEGSYDDFDVNDVIGALEVLEEVLGLTSTEHK
jgi:hypothetical protein